MEKTLDYNVYKELEADLICPIESPTLNKDITVRLYESKLIYLENLRVKCFKDMNMNSSSKFTTEDYNFILKAKQITNAYLKEVILDIIKENLKKFR